MRTKPLAFAMDGLLPIHETQRDSPPDRVRIATAPLKYPHLFGHTLHVTNSEAKHPYGPWPRHESITAVGDFPKDWNFSIAFETFKEVASWHASVDVY